MLNTDLPWDLAIPLLDIYSRGLKTYVYTKTCRWMYTAAFFIMPKGGNKPDVHQFINGWIKCELSNTMEYYLAIKRNKYLYAMYWISKPIIPWMVHGVAESDTTEYLSLSHDSVGKESACNVGDSGSIPGWRRPPGEGMATHSSILAWRIPWAKEPGRLHPWGRRVGQDWDTFTSIDQQ